MGDEKLLRHAKLRLKFSYRPMVLCRPVAQSCPTLCDPVDCSSPGFPVLHYLLELAQTYVHGVTDAIQSSHSLLPLSLPELNLSQHQDIFQ